MTLEKLLKNFQALSFTFGIIKSFNKFFGIFVFEVMKVSEKNLSGTFLTHRTYNQRFERFQNKLFISIHF